MLLSPLSCLCLPYVYVGGEERRGEERRGEERRGGGKRRRGEERREGEGRGGEGRREGEGRGGEGRREGREGKVLTTEDLSVVKEVRISRCTSPPGTHLLTPT